MKKIISLILLLFINFNFASIATDSSAPSFELLNSYGKKISLDNFTGKTIILEWTNHDCPFVAKHYATGNMQSTQKQAKDQNVIWLTIISSAPGTQGYVLPEKANELSSSRDALPNHVLFDPDGNVGRMYGAKTTPHMYIIDKKGLLRYQGAIDDAGGKGFWTKNLFEADNHVKDALSKLQKGEEITTKVSKPYGCSVKYKG
tara:strand:- start:2566 stop:3171 length:606 start_codon:yes stop_codon:yes gene_type:complete